MVNRHLYEVTVLYENGRGNRLKIVADTMEQATQWVRYNVAGVARVEKVEYNDPVIVLEVVA